MGFENLRTIPSLRARAIGDLKSMGIIGKIGVDVKVKSPSLRGHKILMTECWEMQKGKQVVGRGGNGVYFLSHCWYYG